MEDGRTGIKLRKERKKRDKNKTSMGKRILTVKHKQKKWEEETTFLYKGRAK